ncbi:Biopolymer transport protein ExbB [Planctomycetes bacterium Pla163]|uniref:Biopolymer transport protein ExbB n=1 Tax=Rohdeia mirabilis TaxID=2528008 RepID=A0A518D2I3_9BACT|nr:Biopolymer transport protein ExbB [Planctomycetes bacterium Pla163]
MNAPIKTALSMTAFAAFAGTAFAQSKTPDVTVSELITDAGGFGYFLILLSIISLALTIEGFISLKRDKLAPPELIDEVQALFDEDQFQEAMELCEDQPSFFTKVCGAGISKIGHDFTVIETAIEEMGDEESIRLHQKIGWLALLANVAPMVGLLGTVWGMILAFKTISATQGQASPAELAEGISIALLTTMFGLLVAIPTTAAFAFLRNNLVRSVIEVGAIVEDLFERFRPGEAALRQ